MVGAGLRGRGLGEAGLVGAGPRVEGRGLAPRPAPSVRPGARPAGGAAAFPKGRGRRGPAGSARQVFLLQSRTRCARMLRAPDCMHT